MGDGPFSLLLSNEKKKQKKLYIADTSPSIWKHTLFHPSPSFNYALGGKGFVYGRVALFYGPESSGKSLNAMIMIAEMQRLDPEGYAIYISSEYDIPREKMENLGVDMSRVLCKLTNIPSEIFDWIEKDVVKQIEAGTKIKIIVIDTIKAIRGPKEQALIKPKPGTAKKTSESHVMGDLSQYLQKAFKLILDPIRMNEIFLILVQQVTEEFDETRKLQGHKWVIPSGKALHHVSDYYCLFEKISKKESKLYDPNIRYFNDKLKQIGHRIRIKIGKNRTDGAIDGMAEFDIQYGVGIVNTYIEIAELAHRTGVVERPTTVSYVYKDKKWTSKDDYYNAIKEDDKLMTELYCEVLKRA